MFNLLGPPSRLIARRPVHTAHMVDTFYLTGKVRWPLMDLAAKSGRRLLCNDHLVCWIDRYYWAHVDFALAMIFISCKNELVVIDDLQPIVEAYV